MSGAKLTHAQREVLPLSDEQKQLIDWHENAGEEPPGG